MEQDPVEKNIDMISYAAMHDFLSGEHNMTSFTEPALEIIDHAIFQDMDLWEAAMSLCYRGDTEFGQIYLRTAELIYQNLYNTEL